MANKLQWNGKSYGGKFGNACFMFLLRCGTLPAYALLAGVAAFFMLFRRKQCAESSVYLSKIFGRKIRAVSPECYAHLFSFGRSIIDKTAYFSGADIKTQDLCRKPIEAALERGRGCVVVVSHIGGWAISGGELAKYPYPTGVIGVSNEHADIEKMLSRSLKRRPPQMIAKATDPFAFVAALSLLRKNGIVAVHSDRYVAGKAAEVEFLGEKVRIPVSAYALAEKSDAALAVVFCTREKSGAYKMFSTRIFAPSKADAPTFDARAKLFAENYARDIEGVLADHPYQWYNFYPFWRQ